MNINPKESSALLTALQGGVVPSVGIQHITVGRDDESQSVIDSLNSVALGNNDVKFWIGDFGSGKSFMIRLIETLALRKNFVVTTADFTPDTRMYSNDGKAVLLYQKLIDQLATQTNQSGNALPAILEQWIERIMGTVGQKRGLSFDDLQLPENQSIVSDEIIRELSSLSSVGSFEFGQAVAKYYEGYASDNVELQKAAIRWLRGEYTAKSDSRRDLGIREIVNDQNYYDMLKNFAAFFVQLGYQGFVINFDEVINLYNIVQSQVRDKNYEKILSIYNDCLQNKTSHLYINFAGTRKLLEDERRGLFSYNALKTRLQSDEFVSSHRNLSQPVIYLPVLGSDEIFVLLSKLKEVFESNYGIKISMSHEQIAKFMAGYLNRPGANEHLTPREVTRGFLQLLNILRQHPETSVDTLLSDSTESESSSSHNDVEIL